MPLICPDKAIDAQPIVVVSGLPRSGTSMMMRMLDAGGLEVVTDQIRTADEDNPKGYYEFERVKKIVDDQDWLPGARGKVVKIISFLLLKAPPTFDYKVVFLRRALPEVLASQQQMLIRRGDNTPQDDVRMAQLYEKHLVQAKAWLEGQPNVDVLYVDHGEALADAAGTARMVNAFLNNALNEEAMAGAVDPSLHRQRA